MRPLELSIPKPCHENWDSFTPTEKGGFCAACQKEVIDFTTWSDEAVLAYFYDRKKSTSACGRFKTDQLKIYALPTANTRKTWIPAAALGATLLLNPPDGHGQTAQTPLEHQVVIKTGEVEEKPSVKDRVIRGQVFDNENGSAMLGASVLLKHSSLGATTDAEGQFEFTIPEPTTSDTLVISFVGYVTQEIPAQSQQPIQIQLRTASTRLPECVVTAAGYATKRSMMGGLVVVSRTHKCSPLHRIWDDLKDLFIKRK
jgi:hypothetical protein